MHTSSNTLLEAIAARHSVRSYTSEKLSTETINALLRAAVQAPTAMHEESWAFVVVQDQKLLSEISALARPLFAKSLETPGQPKRHSAHDFNDPNFNIFYDASTLIIITTTLSGSFVEADCWLAAENLMLAACAMGLGTCVIGSAVMALNVPNIKARLNIPSEYQVVVPIVCGTPKGETPKSVRKEPKVISWV
jgi:nitroreductase